jgi:hypothetical protein
MEMKKISLFGAVIASVVLAACGSSVKVIEEGVGYAVVYDHYLGVAEITTENGVVTDVSIDEYFLPYSWAKVSQMDSEAFPQETVVRTWKRTPTSTSNTIDRYAKYIKVGDKLLTANIIGDEPNQQIVYSGSDITNFEEWVDIETNAVWYINQVKANQLFLTTSDGTTHSSLTRFDVSSNLAMTKSASGYWSVLSPGLGWSGNMEAIVDLLVGSTMDFDPADFTKATVAPLVWGNGDIITGVTLTNFKDYLSLALRAYANLELVEA